MTIKAYFDIQKPDEVAMRMTIVMPVKDWKRVAEVLSADEGVAAVHWHPATEMNRLISELIRKAAAGVWDESSDPKAAA